jgi:hypothetical protein
LRSGYEWRGCPQAVSRESHRTRNKNKQTNKRLTTNYERRPAGTTRMSLPQSGCTYSTRTRAVTTLLGRNDGTCRTVEPKEERARKFAPLACSIAPIQASAGTNQEQRVCCHASSMTRVREGNHDVMVLGGTACKPALNSAFATGRHRIAWRA